MPQIFHISLTCQDLRRSIRFYGHVLGLREWATSPSSKTAYLYAGEVQLELVPGYPPAEETASRHSMQLGLLLEDLPATWRRLAEWGSDWIEDGTPKAIREQDIPPLTFTVLDPDGRPVRLTGNQTEWSG